MVMIPRSSDDQMARAAIEAEVMTARADAAARETIRLLDEAADRESERVMVEYRVKHKSQDNADVVFVIGLIVKYAVIIGVSLWIGYCLHV